MGAKKSQSEDSADAERRDSANHRLPLAEGVAMARCKAPIPSVAFGYVRACWMARYTARQ